jgi:hypothetical protein
VLQSVIYKGLKPFITYVDFFFNGLVIACRLHLPTVSGKSL